MQATHLANIVRWVLWVVAVHATLQCHNSWAMTIHNGPCVLASMTLMTNYSSAAALHGRCAAWQVPTLITADLAACLHD